MRGRALPSANFDNYGRVAGSDSFIKNLMFASPPLKIDIEPGKIDVAVVLLNINVLEDDAQSLGHHWLQGCIGLSPDPIARGLCQAGARTGAARASCLTERGGTSCTEEFSCVRTGDLTPLQMIDVVIAGNDSKMLEARVRV